jgi:hypothetical protein
VAPAVAEHEQRPAHGFLEQHLPRDRRHPVDALPEVHRLVHHEHARLRRDLDHRIAPKPHAAQSNPIISGVCSNTRSVTPDLSTSAIGRGCGAEGALSVSRENVGTDSSTRFCFVLGAKAAFACPGPVRNSRVRSTRVTRTTAFTPCFLVACSARPQRLGHRFPRIRLPPPPLGERGLQLLQ